MNDQALARLFEAMYGGGDRPCPKTRKKAAQRLVCSEDGLTLIKHLSPCLQTRINALPGVSLDYLEGRRSVLLEIINLALRQEEGTQDG